MKGQCEFPQCDCRRDCRHWVRPIPSLERTLVRAAAQAHFSGSDTLMAAVGKPCPYCARPMYCDDDGGWGAPTRDHVLPRSRGGTFLESRNRLIVCRRCNEDKADRTIIEFAGWLDARKDSRAERVKALAIDLAMEGDEVLAPEECRVLA